MTASRSSRYRSRGLLLFPTVLLAAGLAAPHLWAWHQLRAGREELGRYHPESARRALGRCLRVWPDHPTALLLASRAARGAGDLEDADRQLRACQRARGGTSDEVAFEWALLRAAAGNVREVDAYLQQRAEEDAHLAPLAWEAMAQGYLRVYSTLDAMAVLNLWLQLDKDNVRALELRGATYITGKGVKFGAEDLRRAVGLDPTRDEARRRLTRALLDLGAYGEAAEHLEVLAARTPDDPDVLVRLARCYNMLNRRDEAARALDAVLAAHPDHGLALRTRGQFALADQHPDEAEGWLRPAAAALPDDYQAQWFLFQALQQQGKTGEAAAQLKAAEQVRDRVERLGELQSRKLAEHPLDPALHYEMGMLLMRTGHPDVGEQWLLTALGLDPDYRPAHAALADYYQQKGKWGEAADHRRRAEEGHKN